MEAGWATVRLIGSKLEQGVFAVNQNNIAVFAFVKLYL
jgi:hypothetical protein